MILNRFEIIRLRNNKSKTEFCNLLGFSNYQYYRSFISGVERSCDEKKVTTIANIGKCSVQWLIYEIDDDIRYYFDLEYKSKIENYMNDLEVRKFKLNLSIGERIKELTYESNHLLKDLEKNGIFPLGSSYKYTNDKLTPNLGMMIKLSKYLHVNIDELFGSEIIYDNFIILNKYNELDRKQIESDLNKIQLKDWR